MHAKIPLAFLLVAVASGGLAAQASEPAFTGDFVFRWLTEPNGRHRQMQLLGEVSFFDGEKNWDVPVDTIVDGASIPPVLWSFAGSPFVGNYRRASVIHDHYCTLTVAPPNVVHWMFYNAMLADGVDGVEALEKYGAVSVYTWLGGGCARGVDAVEDLRSLESPGAFVRTDELLAFTMRLDNLDLSTGARLEAAQHVKMISQVEKPQSFDALVEFRITPSELNLQRMEQAFRQENTTAQEVRELSTLANSVVRNSPANPLQ